MNISIVGGAGRAGLPLSLIMASKGLNVFVIDKDIEKINLLNKGKIPFLEKGSLKLLKKFNKNIIFTDKYDYISKSQIIILTTGTPIDEHLNPDIKLVTNLINNLVPYFKDNQTLILRSTLFPGTTAKICKILKSKKLRMQTCFCPERISQGNGVDELSNLPQIISGNTKKAVNISRKLFSRFTKEIYELSFEEAEITKLFSNAWRYIKFSIANQFYSICIEKNMDFQKIRNVMMKNYPRAQDFPNSGFSAGPCLFKDTMQLASYSRDNFSLGHASMIINETLPNLLVNKLKMQKKISNTNIGILGMAFKPNNDDSRESLAFKMKKILEHEESNVLCSDLFIRDRLFVTPKELLKKCNIIFIGCPHSEYKKLKFQSRHIIIDCWGFFYEKKYKKNISNWF